MPTATPEPPSRSPAVEIIGHLGQRTTEARTVPTCPRRLLLAEAAEEEAEEEEAEEEEAAPPASAA